MHSRLQLSFVHLTVIVLCSKVVRRSYISTKPLLQCQYGYPNRPDGVHWNETSRQILPSHKVSLKSCEWNEAPCNATTFEYSQDNTSLSAYNNSVWFS